MYIKKDESFNTEIMVLNYLVEHPTEYPHIKKEYFHRKDTQDIFEYIRKCKKPIPKIELGMTKLAEKDVIDTIYAARLDNPGDWVRQLTKFAIMREAPAHIVSMFTKTVDDEVEWSDWYKKATVEQVLNKIREEEYKLRKEQDDFISRYSSGVNDFKFEFTLPQNLPQADKEDEEIVNDMLWDSSFNEIVAPAKSGKSQLAYQLATCLTGGVPFLNYLCKKCNVVYVDWELKDSAIRKRTENAKKFLGVEEDFLVLGMNKFGDKTLDDVLDLIVEEHKKNPIQVVILDNFYSFCNGDTNSMGDVKGILLKIKRKLTYLGICVVMVNHVNKVKSTENPTTPTAQDILNSPFGSSAHSYIVDTTILIQNRGEGKMIYACGRNIGTPIEIPCTYREEDDFFFRPDAASVPQPYDKEVIEEIEKYMSENKYRVSFKTYKKHFPDYCDGPRLKVSGFKVVRESNGNYYISMPKIFYKKDGKVRCF